MAQDTSFSKKSTLNIRGNLYELGNPKVMGIINITPDSFYPGSRSKGLPDILRKAEKMISEGADFLDIGGYSTRPGATMIDEDEELKRVVPAIEAVFSEFPEIPISIDTFRSRIGREAVMAGASIINDVSGGSLDQEMFATVANLHVPYILMHMRGTPETMKELSQYKNVITEVIAELQEKVLTLNELGVADIIIDPGFGFAKNIPQNFEMLKNLNHFSSLEFPLLIGISRKSMIYKSLNLKSEDALNGTSALHMVALQNGATILRVHDVKEAKEVVKLYTLTFS